MLAILFTAIFVIVSAFIAAVLFMLSEQQSFVAPKRRTPPDIQSPSSLPEREESKIYAALMYHNKIAARRQAREVVSSMLTRPLRPASLDGISGELPVLCNTDGHDWHIDEKRTDAYTAL